MSFGVPSVPSFDRGSDSLSLVPSFDRGSANFEPLPASTHSHTTAPTNHHVVWVESVALFKTLRSHSQSIDFLFHHPTFILYDPDSLTTKALKERMKYMYTADGAVRDNSRFALPRTPQEEVNHEICTNSTVLNLPLMNYTMTLWNEFYEGTPDQPLPPIYEVIKRYKPFGVCITSEVVANLGYTAYGASKKVFGITGEWDIYNIPGARKIGSTPTKLLPGTAIWFTVKVEEVLKPGETETRIPFHLDKRAAPIEVAYHKKYVYVFDCIPLPRGIVPDLFEDLTTSTIWDDDVNNKTRSKNGKQEKYNDMTMTWEEITDLATTPTTVKAPAKGRYPRRLNMTGYAWKYGYIFDYGSTTTKVSIVTGDIRRDITEIEKLPIVGIVSEYITPPMYVVA